MILIYCFLDVVLERIGLVRKSRVEAFVSARTVEQEKKYSQLLTEYRSAFWHLNEIQKAMKETWDRTRAK